MATNDISKHFKITVKNSNGSRTDTTITSDTQFANFAANTLIRNVVKKDLGNSKNYGYAAAMGICLGILIIIIAIIQMVVSKERRGNGKHAKAFEKFKQGR